MGQMGDAAGAGAEQALGEGGVAGGADPDLDPLRGDSRFQAMLAAAEARQAAGEQVG